MNHRLAKISKILLKMADACPLCGDEQAINRTYHTSCTNKECKNYDVVYSLEKKSKVVKLSYRAIDRIYEHQDTNSALATKYQKELNSKQLSKLEATVLEFGSPEQAYLFAKDVKGANTKALEAKVYSSRDYKVIYMYAKHIDDADIKSAENLIVDSGKPDLIHLFAKNVYGADLARLESVLHYLKM
jgi:hypothetical protein